MTTPFRLTGMKTLTLSAEDVALILDSLAVQPYVKVHRIIANIVEQANDRNPTPEAEPIRTETP